MPHLQQRPSNLGMSRKTTLEIPVFTSIKIESQTEKQLEPTPEERAGLDASKIHRSQSGANIQVSRDVSKHSQGHYAELEQKC